MITKKLKKRNGALTAKASVWYTLSNIFSRGVTILLTPVFTRILSPEQYGIYPLYVSWMGIFTVIGTFEIPGGVMYRTLTKFKDERDGVVSSALGVQAMLSLAFFTVYIILRRRINAITTLSTSLSLILILQVFLNGVEGIHFASERYLYRYRGVSFINIICGFAGPLFALMLISRGMGGISRVISPLIVTALFVIPIIFISVKREARIFSREKWKYLFKISLPMLPHYLALSVIASADKIIVSRIAGEGAIGKYSVAYSVGFMISLITNGLSLALTPWIMRKLADGETQETESKISLITDTVVTLTLIFFGLAPEVFGFAAPPEYADAFSAIYPLGISVVFLFLSGALSSAILHYEKPFSITLNSLISAGIFLPLAYVLILRLSYFGGALATLISYMIMLTLNLISFRKISGYNILNIKNCLQNTGKLFLFSVLLYMARYVPVSRILVILVVVLLFLAKIKKQTEN